jgi:energy-coupling factor transporter ATP-binding protein EcfA2
VKSYKNLALGIVRRWQMSGEYLVDRHISFDMRGQGFMVTVVGPCGSGKSTLALQIARRIHKIGFRTPALIDETVFDRFIDKPRRSNTGVLELHRPFFYIRDMACRTHTPVVVTVTLRAVNLRPTTGHEHQQSRLAVLASHDILCFSDLVWMTERRGGEFFASLAKSRTANPMSSDIKVFPNREYRVEDCPYFQRGIELARQIEQRHG